MATWYPGFSKSQLEIYGIEKDDSVSKGKNRLCASLHNMPGQRMKKAEMLHHAP
jgi:hypothetical protein